jgi:hypothetical protein
MMPCRDGENQPMKKWRDSKEEEEEEEGKEC